jgi:hypothetical protein
MLGEVTGIHRHFFDGDIGRFASRWSTCLLDMAIRPFRLRN